jgi:DNA repair exonuclease SbcCD nuclease subunit
MFVGVGDLHLTDSVGKGGLSNYLDDHDAMVADLVIKQPLRYAIKHGIKDLVFLGDICESPRLSYLAQLALSRIIDTAHKHHIKCWFYLGNHDLLSEDPSVGHSLEVLKLWGRANVEIITEPTDTSIGGISVRVLPWPHKNFSKTRLNLAHIDVSGSKTDSGRLNDKEGLNASQAWALIGHIHTSQRVRNSFYPGTLYQTNFGEAASKFFAVVSQDDGFDVELISVRLPYQLHTIEVNSKADLKDVPTGKNHLVKLIVRSSKVQTQDWSHLNVVKTVTAKTDTEAAQAHFEELGTGAAVEISSDEFFQAWLDNQTKPDALKTKALALRKRLLSGVVR